MTEHDHNRAGYDGVRPPERTVRPSEQTYIPGTEPPNERIPDVDERLYAWLNAKDEQRRAADTTKIRHASLLEKLAELGLTRYRYLDPHDGKKREVVVAREPKAKTLKAEGMPRRARNDAKAEKRSERRKRDRDAAVEHRTVPRTSVEQEIDPFAATRAQMDAVVAAVPGATDVTLTTPDGEVISLTSAKAQRSKAKRKNGKPS